MTRATPQRARKLTDDQVREIRSNTISGPELAKYYGVTQKVIWSIRNRQSYQHVRDTP
jgi:DNA-binding transcriptional regulator YiaG